MQAVRKALITQVLSVKITQVLSSLKLIVYYQTLNRLKADWTDNIEACPLQLFQAEIAQRVCV